MTYFETTRVSRDARSSRARVRARGEPHHPHAFCESPRLVRLALGSRALLRLAVRLDPLRVRVRVRAVAGAGVRVGGVAVGVGGVGGVGTVGIRHFRLFLLGGGGGVLLVLLLGLLGRLASLDDLLLRLHLVALALGGLLHVLILGVLAGLLGRLGRAHVDVKFGGGGARRRESACGERGKTRGGLRRSLCRRLLRVYTSKSRGART
mmetsp:Transcript_10931/g.46673  ORF Transcript_10931/g.46673 Transcript_10931/m.46673 type:complete len:207 (+) Transcript_10931:15-635(+)